MTLTHFLSICKVKLTLFIIFQIFIQSQEYHFGNKEWSIVPTSGYPVRGGFGHSSVWDEITNRIYVFGGYVSTASTAAGLSNDLYSFDPIVKKWTFHSPGLTLLKGAGPSVRKPSLTFPCGV